MNPADIGHSRSLSQIDQLRSRLEHELLRPCVIVFCSSTDADGRDGLSFTLAQSFAGAGYSTLFLDATANAMKTPLISGSSTARKTVENLQTILAEKPTINFGFCEVLSFRDPTSQKMTSKREIQTALETLRTNHDFIVVNSDNIISTSFAASIASASDAIFVCVRTGRRESRSDAKLAAELGRLGSQFRGVIAVDRSLADAHFSFGMSQTSNADARSIQSIRLGNEAKVKEFPS